MSCNKNELNRKYRTYIFMNDYLRIQLSVIKWRLSFMSFISEAETLNEAMQ